MRGEFTLEMEHLVRIERFMASMCDLDQLLAAIMEEAARAVDAQSCSLALHDEGSDELYFYAVRGTEAEREFERTLKCVRLRSDAGVAGWCMTHRKAVNIADVYTDPRFDPSIDKKTGFTTQSILAVPMSYQGRQIGVVEAVNKRGGGTFSARDESVLTVLGAQATLVIENARLYQDNLRQARLSALGQGIAGAAHCIKNILNGVTGGAFILENALGKQDAEKAGKGWGILKRNLEIMKGLVLDMLAYSKPRVPEIQPCDINKVCADVAALVRERVDASRTRVCADLQPEAGVVMLDPTGIYRCILNLVFNAADAVDKPDGKVTVTTRLGESGRVLEIAVADNGCGISEENRKKMFQAFFSTKGSKGTGLGLAVTQKIIHEHGGDIRVDSQTGVGTTFTISLPLSRPPPESLPSSGEA